MDSLSEGVVCDFEKIYYNSDLSYLHCMKGKECALETHYFSWNVVHVMSSSSSVQYYYFLRRTVIDDPLPLNLLVTSPALR